MTPPLDAAGPDGHPVPASPADAAPATVNAPWLLYQDAGAPTPPPDEAAAPWLHYQRTTPADAPWLVYRKPLTTGAPTPEEIDRANMADLKGKVDYENSTPHGAVGRFALGIGQGAVSGTGETLKGAAELAVAAPALAYSARSKYYPDYAKFPEMTPDEQVALHRQIQADGNLTAGDKVVLQARLGQLERGAKPMPLEEFAPPPPDATQTGLYRAGQSVSDAADTIFPMTAAEKDTVTAKLGQGVGGVAPAMVAGAAGSLVGAPELGLVAGAGQMGSMSAASAASEARKAGASPENVARAAITAGVVNTAIGAVDVGAVLRPIEQSAPGILPWAVAQLKKAAQNGVVFAGIGEAQKWVAGEIAQHFYDPKAAYTFDPAETAVNALTGAVMSAGHAAASAPFDALRPARAGTEPAETPAGDAAAAPASAPPGAAEAPAPPPATPRPTKPGAKGPETAEEMLARLVAEGEPPAGAATLGRPGAAATTPEAPAAAETPDRHPSRRPRQSRRGISRPRSRPLPIRTIPKTRCSLRQATRMRCPASYRMV